MMKMMMIEVEEMTMMRYYYYYCCCWFVVAAAAAVVRLWSNGVIHFGISPERIDPFSNWRTPSWSCVWRSHYSHCSSTMTISLSLLCSLLLLSWMLEMSILDNWLLIYYCCCCYCCCKMWWFRCCCCCCSFSKVLLRKSFCVSSLSSKNVFNDKLKEQDWINYNTVQVGGRVCVTGISQEKPVVWICELLFVVRFAVVAVLDDNFVWLLLVVCWKQSQVVAWRFVVWDPPPHPEKSMTVEKTVAAQKVTFPLIRPH